MSGRRRGGATPLSDAEWLRVWVQLLEISWSAPMVIGHRTARLLRGGWPPDVADRREYTRMWQEKAEVLGRAYLAAITTPPLETARLAGRIVGPVHRKVVGNRRRLSRL